MTTFPSDSFTCSREHGLLADASDLRVGLHRLAESTDHRRIAVRSARTGRVLQYERSRVQRDAEGELQAVHYRPMNFVGCHTLTRSAQAGLPTVTIFND